MSFRLLRTTGRALAAVGLTGSALLAPAGQASAAPQPIGRCTSSSGVVLAVDFSHWGGPVYRSCGTTPTTGYELLNQGGWRTTGTGHDGPAFICRIGYSGHQGGRQYPTSQQEDCVLTPPASAYWSYWHADPGENTWEYRPARRDELPAPAGRRGSVDLRRDEHRGHEGPTDRHAGPAARPQHPSHGRRSGDEARAGPRTDDAATGRRRPGSPSPPPKPSESASPSASASPSPSASATASPGASGSATPSAAVAAPQESAKVVDAAPAADAEHDSGSIVPVAVTAALVVVIGGAAVFAVKRRHREQ